jgi:hypothetical protein
MGDTIASLSGRVRAEIIMWSRFRAMADRIGLVPSDRKRGERARDPTLVQDPLNSDISYRVRSDPDWTQRLSQALNGTLVNSRQERVATIAVPNGKIFIASTNSPAEPVVADVVPGEYEIILTIAHQGNEATFDYEEDTSHIAVIFRDKMNISRIEPLLSEHGKELGLLGYLFMLSGSDVLPQLAGDHAGQWALRSSALMHPTLEDGTRVKLYSAKLEIDEIGEAILFYGGHGRGDYPLYRMVDTQDNTVGLMADFFIDNRPWPEELDG